MDHDEYESMLQLHEVGKDNQDAPKEVKLKIACEILKEVSHDWKEEEVKFYPKSLDSFDDVISDLGKIEFKSEEDEEEEEKKDEELQEIFKAIKLVEKTVNQLVK